MNDLDKEIDKLKMLIQDYNICDLCDRKHEFCMEHFSKEVRNEYVRRGLGCLCDVDCASCCPNAKGCIGD